MKDLSHKLIAMVIVATVVFCSNLLSANEGENENGKSVWNSYQSAIQTSNKTGQPVMLVFSGSDWCGWCVRLNNEVFRTDEFNTWARTNVLAVEVDFPRGHALPADTALQNEQLKQKFGTHVEFYPTVLFVNANQQVIGKIGYVEGGAASWIRQASRITSPQPQITQN